MLLAHLSAALAQGLAPGRACRRQTGVMTKHGAVATGTVVGVAIVTVVGVFFLSPGGSPGT